FGAKPVVQLLLDKGASVDVKAPGIVGDVTPLFQAARMGDAAMMKTFVDHGADPKAAGPEVAVFAARAGCEPCVDMVLPSFDPMRLIISSFMLSPPLGNAAIKIPALLERGVPAAAAGPNGLSLLMLAS